jgi:hypothetical protein
MKRGIAPGRSRKGKSTELQGHFLLVTLTGNVDLSSSVRLFNQAFDVAAQKRVDKLLINALAVAGTLSTLERYELGVKVTAHITQLRTNPKVAFVGVLPTVDGFAVRVAQSRDVFVELFRNVPEAVEWLGKWPTSDKLASVSS